MPKRAILVHGVGKNVSLPAMGRGEPFRVLIEELGLVQPSSCLLPFQRRNSSSQEF